MPTIRLTQAAVDRLAAPAQRTIYFDRHLPGFGLRMTPNGAKSWICCYRVDGKKVMQTIAPVAHLPKIAEARALARQSLEAAARGTDPVAEKKAQVTVADAVERYLSGVVTNLRPKTSHEWCRILRTDVVPRWGKRPLADIKKADVLMLVHEKAATAPVQDNRVLQRLRTFFLWAVAQDLIVADPSAGLRKPTRESSRSRALSDAELMRLWYACDAMGGFFSPIVKLMVLTAQRESEIAGLRWSELDLDEGVWHLPPSRAKNAKAHIIHLAPVARDILATVPCIAGQDLLFSNNGRLPVTGYSAAKVKLGRLMGPMPTWVFHDLRRTATTGMARLGLPPHVVDRLLNHTGGTLSAVALVYNQFEYLAERREALERWGAHVAALVDGNVVPLRATG